MAVVSVGYCGKKMIIGDLTAFKSWLITVLEPL